MIAFVALLLGLVVGTPAHAQGQFASEGEAFLVKVRAFDAPAAMGMLRKPGNNLVDFRGRRGEAALHIAVRGKKLTWVDALAGFNANVDIRDNDGETPLMIAARAGLAEIAGRLIGYGADVNLANRSGETAAILAVRSRNEAILQDLIRNGADPEISDHVSGLSARDYAMRDTRNPRLLEIIDNTKKQDDFKFGPILR